MSQSNLHLLDLPNEILLTILTKLDNIDVLYSLFGIKNKRFDILVQDDMFNNTLNFVTRPSISDKKLDRFCTFILPRNHHCIKKLVLEPTILERVLLAGDYPSLTSLTLFNFRQEIVARYFTNDSVFRYIFKHQIRYLILLNNDKYTTEASLKVYNTNVYPNIMDLFENLQELSIVGLSVNNYPPLSFRLIPSTKYFSSTLTILCINVFCIDDCLSVLDRGLTQLTKFIVQVENIDYSCFIFHNQSELRNLKCFSLTSYNITVDYDKLILPLLHRMTHLEKLTLYLRIQTRSRLFDDGSPFLNDMNPFVDDTHLERDILVHMPQLHTFIFYISTETIIRNSSTSNRVIQRPFTNIKYGQMACITEYFSGVQAICHVYSLPFAFTRLKKITNQFPDVLFNTVTYLCANDVIVMKPDFFRRISQCFPSLKYFVIINDVALSPTYLELNVNENTSSSIIEYPNLMSLDIRHVYMDTVMQFLLETNTYLPRLTELLINYEQLEVATMNFTNDATRCNCAKVQQLTLVGIQYIPEDVYTYFPLL